MEQERPTDYILNASGFLTDLVSAKRDYSKLGHELGYRQSVNYLSMGYSMVTRHKKQIERPDKNNK